jgi:RF-1 domain
MNPKENPRNLSADELLPQCRWETFRGPGPGGQKRNKTSSSVRIVHIPTGLTATAGEFRSQQQNKANALRRLRHRMAIELREPVCEPFAVPEGLARFFAGWKLQCSIRDETYPAVLGLILDVIEARQGAIGDSASAVGLTTANLVKFLQRDGEALAAVNRLRKRTELRPLGGSS